MIAELTLQNDKMKKFPPQIKHSSKLPEKRNPSGAAWFASLAISASMLVLSMLGCGASTTISSFTANPTSVSPGGVVSLTAAFSPNAGVIMPGNLSIRSGQPVTVNPTSTTTYTLVVSPLLATGATVLDKAVVANVTVTVVQDPTITGFLASPSTTSPGVSAKLTATFAGGTGVINPGNLGVTSGVPVTVSPGTTTIYTLNVTNSAGKVATHTTTVTVGPAPTITTLNPSSTTATGATFTMIVNGTGFLPGAAVQWNGAALSTTFGSSTELLASIPANLFAVADKAIVTVDNPGGSTSNSVNFLIDPPLPMVASLSPVSASAAGQSFTLIVNGTGFFNGASIEWNGISLPTTFVNSTQVRASVDSTLIGSQGVANIVVGSSGSRSNALNFSIGPAAPVISSLSPLIIASGGPAFALTVNGTGLLSGATVQWNGFSLPTTFVNSTQLTATVPASLIANAGNASIAVTNPGGTTSNTGPFFITGWVTLANTQWVVDGDDSLTINSDGSWSATTDGSFVYGIGIGGVAVPSGTNWEGFQQLAPFPLPNTIVDVSHWRIVVSSQTHADTLWVDSYTPTSVTLRGVDPPGGVGSNNIAIQYQAIPTVSGYVNPKYLIMGVTYAPPGGANSSVSYQNSFFTGNTTTVSNSFSTEYMESVSLGIAVKLPSDATMGFSGGATATQSNTWTQKTTDSKTVTLTKTDATTFKTPGVPNVYSPLNHDYDLIWLWLNPTVHFSIPADTNTNHFILWNGYGFDLNDPLQDVDVWPIYVGYLNGHFGPMSAQDSDVLNRSWVTGQTFAPGDTPAITSADFPTILKADPFAYNTADANAGYIINVAPGSSPATTVDGRFTALLTNGTSPQSFPYAQAPLNSASGVQETYQLTNVTTNMNSHVTDNSYSTSFGLDLNASYNFTKVLSVNAALKQSYKLTWDNMVTTSQTTTTTQNNTAQIAGPPCPALAAPCNPEYSEPHAFSLYQDNLYGTFLFWPNPYFDITSVVPSSATVSAGGTASYIVSTLAHAGYAGSSLTLSVSGLPGGGSDNTKSGTVAPGNAFGLNITTTASTPKGSYPLKIGATDGTQAYFAYVILVVD